MNHKEEQKKEITIFSDNFSDTYFPIPFELPFPKINEFEEQILPIEDDQKPSCWVKFDLDSQCEFLEEQSLYPIEKCPFDEEKSQFNYHYSDVESESCVSNISIQKSFDPLKKNISNFSLEKRMEFPINSDILLSNSSKEKFPVERDYTEGSSIDGEYNKSIHFINKDNFVIDNFDKNTIKYHLPTFNGVNPNFLSIKNSCIDMIENQIPNDIFQRNERNEYLIEKKKSVFSQENYCTSNVQLHSNISLDAVGEALKTYENQRFCPVENCRTETSLEEEKTDLFKKNNKLRKNKKNKYQSQERKEQTSYISRKKINLNVCCGICGNYYKTLHTFHTHQQKYHNIFSCNLCFNSFDSSNELESHINIEHYEIIHVYRNEQFLCSKCNSKFDSRQNLLIHYAKRHKKITCKNCERQFNFESEYKEHLNLTNCTKNAYDKILNNEFLGKVFRTLSDKNKRKFRKSNFSFNKQLDLKDEVYMQNIDLNVHKIEIISKTILPSIASLNLPKPAIF